MNLERLNLGSDDFLQILWSILHFNLNLILSIVSNTAHILVNRLLFIRILKIKLNWTSTIFKLHLIIEHIY